jgi:crotonobetainyl-CoA:carnitine CoA-transferase CaiB-like acyl-CoA transferase
LVQTGEDLATADPQLEASAFLRKITDVNPAVGQTYADALPLHFSKTPCETYERVREVGEDNASVLADWLGR